MTEPNTLGVPFAYERKGLSDAKILSLYRGMKYSRMIEEKMLSFLRQGKISKWFSGIGQEAIAVGCTQALHQDEWIFPMHRNLGVFTSREIPLHRLYAQWQGKMEGFTRGRDRSFHFGSMDHHVAGMISHLGPQLSLAAGAAMAYSIHGEPKVSLAFTGEGGTSQGEFHEALNVASVWKLPVIFVIENNGYGLSTPTEQQYACSSLHTRGVGYGMKALQINGNDVLEVYNTITAEAERMRHHPEPLLIECMTFRRRGHEEASGTKYVPVDMMQYWEERDPIGNMETFLLQENMLSQDELQSIELEIKAHIKSELARAEKFADPQAGTEVQDVYRDGAVQEEGHTSEATTEMRFVDALALGLEQSMADMDELVLMGQDIADYGGVFKITEGLLERYGSARVRNTPLCESAILGIALGASLEGLKTMVEMQFADFVSCGFNQIVNNIAKIGYRWDAPADIVVRMPTGGGMGAGPFHSQSNEAWFFHVPGLRIAYPSTPQDARDMLWSVLKGHDPCMFFEHKGLYRSVKGEVTEAPQRVPLGKSRLVQEGTDGVIITYGMGVHWAQQLAAHRSESIEILDLRWLAPLDYQAIRESVFKTHRALILHEDTLVGGIGGEISAWIQENCFEALDAPVFRCASLDTPVPFASNLESDFLASARLQETWEKLMDY